ncbi:MAG: TonB-dependent receptor, partial [Saprospiraceae bacterium]|nr:TonB-dependent receptor [Saprospiraceae bacterium]
MKKQFTFILFFALSLLNTTKAQMMASVKGAPPVSASVEKTSYHFVLTKASREVAFEKIERITGSRFVYNADKLGRNESITIAEGTYSLEQILTSIEAQTALRFKRVGNMIGVSKTMVENSAIKMSSLSVMPIKGKITDTQSGEPIVGASVTVKGTNRGAVSGEDGSYTLEANAGDVLLVSFIGYETKKVTVGSSETIDIALSEGMLSLDNVVVIGSRNATRTKLETPVAVDVIPIQQVMNDVGQVDLNQILTYVAPSFQSSRQTISDGTDHVDPAQMRGLGPDQVLVLINGKRRHQSSLVNVNGTVNRGTVGTDLNAIPASSIERIEILRDGAAAQYGSDAIAGVINIVLKKSVGLTAIASGGTHVTQYQKNYAWNLLNPNAKLEEKTSATDGQTLQLALNYGLKVGEKGYLNLTGEYVSRGLTNRTGLYTGRIWGLVNGQNRTDSINAAKNLTRDNFQMNIGNSEVKGGGIVANFAIPISDELEIYAFGGFNNKKGRGAGFYRFPFGSEVTATPGLIRNKIEAIYPSGFLPFINSDVTDISFVGGLRGKIAGWNMDISQVIGRNQFDYTIDNSVNYSQAADTTFSGALQTTFNAGGSTFSQYTSNLDFSKNHQVLEGLNTALGAEFRLDQFGIQAGEEASWKNYNTKSGIAAGAQVFAGFLPSNAGSFTRNNFAIYSDNEIDVTKNLMFSAALRFENYSDFGSTFNYKVASRFKIADIFTIRASHSTGFRAPSQQQKFYSKTNTIFVTGSGGVQEPVEAGTFTNESKAASILGIPKLKQETSTSFAIGATARVKAFELTVDAYQIDINDRIILTNNFGSGGDATLKTQLDAAGASTVNFFTNAVDTRNRGIETVASYDFNLGNNHNLRLTLAGSFIQNRVRDSSDLIEGNSINQPFVKTSEQLRRTNQVGNYFNREDESRLEIAAPNSKVSAMINYKLDKFSVMLRAVRFGEVVYLDPTMNSPANFLDNTFNSSTNKETLDQTFKPKIVTDLTLGYQITKQLTFSLGANNLFDVIKM